MGSGWDRMGSDRMGSDGGKFGMCGVSGAVLDVWGPGVRLGGVMGRAPLRGCWDPAGCGERGDLGARIWGSLRDPWVGRVGWVASPSLSQRMGSVGMGSDRIGWEGGSWVGLGAIWSVRWAADRRRTVGAAPSPLRRRVVCVSQPTEFCGGLKVTYLRHYTGDSQTVSTGDKLTYGQLGEVMGPDPDDPDRVYMKFPGNKANVACPLTWLSLNPPVRVGWWVWWVKSGVEGGV